MNEVWRISDIIKMIGEFKHKFEQAQDVKKLNMTQSFQALVFHLFYYKYGAGMVVRNNIGDDRLHIYICKRENQFVVITFELYYKYKHLPYYFDILFLDFNNKAIPNQSTLAQYILSNDMLLIFFQYETNSHFNH